jgi:hypothetical protein
MTEYARTGPMAEPATNLSFVQPAGSMAAVSMDRDFISRNQIVERYFANKLPAKGALDFERYCKEHPELLDELHVAERVHAGLRLLEAGGVPQPWERGPQKFWEKPVTVVILGLAALALGVAAALFANRFAYASAEVVALQTRLATQPLDAIATTRTVRVNLNRSGPSRSNATIIGGHKAELADLKITLNWSKFTQYRVTIDRLDQGRVMVLHNLQRDSNGDLRISLNSSLLGPGSYQLAIEGLTWTGDGVPQGWVTVGVVH